MEAKLEAKMGGMWGNLDSQEGFGDTISSGCNSVDSLYHGSWFFDDKDQQVADFLWTESSESSLSMLTACLWTQTCFVCIWVTKICALLSLDVYSISLADTAISSP
jgi:hypothetical protein